MKSTPSTGTLVLVGGLLGLAIICVSVISFATHTDPDIVIRFITTSVVPTVGIIVTALVVNSKLEETKNVAEEAKQVASAHTDTLGVIQNQTNGAITKLLARNRELEDEINRLKGTTNEGQ